ncbi:MAG: DUF134 domain-containing protein [Desulfurococcus sp.]|nr:DUF134 domain-containing protein [Desulfurococcus sp.]
MPRWCWRRRKWGPGRPPKPLFLTLPPVVRVFTPDPAGSGEERLILPELEALKLVDLDGLNLDEAAALMGVGRGTVWRLLVGARAKLVRALLYGERIVIEPGGEVSEVPSTRDSGGGGGSGHS